MTCPHGMPTPSTCFSCMEEGPVAEPTRWRTVGAVFGAQFDGWCSCGEQIVKGDRVQRWDKGDERTTYTHEQCRP